MDRLASIETQRLRSLNELLARALKVSVEDRPIWLAALEPVDPVLHPLLRRMLERAEVETDTFMRRPLALSASGFGPSALRKDEAGDRLGPYRLAREIGSGGMATVWLAELVDHVDATMNRPLAALKLPRAGRVPCLAHERDILATLEHPNIARLYGSGMTAAARPWLAMEYVQGMPLDQHCETRGLSIAQRLRLFLQVADAVAYVHSRRIVHCDLKPNNILVTSRGDVRLLDFGIARWLAAAAPVASGTELTRLIGPPVTPAYASPEQISGQPLTAATDVYSLGVLLYELLTGAHPYRLADVLGAATCDAVLGFAMPIASSRVRSNRSAAGQLRGDIDDILLKALHKRPEQRYADVKAMAGDIVRHLQAASTRSRVQDEEGEIEMVAGRRNAGRRKGERRQCVAMRRWA